MEKSYKLQRSISSVEEIKSCNNGVYISKKLCDRLKERTDGHCSLIGQLRTGQRGKLEKSILQIRKGYV